LRHGSKHKTRSASGYNLWLIVKGLAQQQIELIWRDKKENPVATYLYIDVPIDTWEGWSTLQEYMNPKGANRARQVVRIGSPEAMAVVELLHLAQDTARFHGSSGHTSEGPYVSGLPFPEKRRSMPIVAWKENGNKDAFVASLIALPWIEDYRVS
jgi:hypothetical protein